MGRLSIPMQDFAEATSIVGNIFASIKQDDVLGLGFHEHAVDFVLPPFYNLINQNLLSKPVFAFYFDDVRRKGNEAEITFGGINHDHYCGDLVELPLRRPNTWEVDFDAVRFGDETIELANTGASTDTGAAMITLPSALAELMYRDLHAHTVR
ncbi:aspartic proteinase precursor [Neophaeococcomyces mojaviensis]|uniref:Aspartic proteinase n=1 Tax=Neophaeococcomyces mojaviensis TaxID=3383035 RepID=A0ACC2ZW30_9EURO|nr:aspartic proteinase precursor [Knufia sp. JES_112]